MDLQPQRKQKQHACHCEQPLSPDWMGNPVTSLPRTANSSALFGVAGANSEATPGILIAGQSGGREQPLNMFWHATCTVEPEELLDDSQSFRGFSPGIPALADFFPGPGTDARPGAGTAEERHSGHAFEGQERFHR